MCCYTSPFLYLLKMSKSSYWPCCSKISKSVAQSMIKSSSLVNDCTIQQMADSSKPKFLVENCHIHQNTLIQLSHCLQHALLLLLQAIYCFVNVSYFNLQFLNFLFVPHHHIHHNNKARPAMDKTTEPKIYNKNSLIKILIIIFTII